MDHGDGDERQQEIVEIRGQPDPLLGDPAYRQEAACVGVVVEDVGQERNPWDGSQISSAG